MGRKLLSPSLPQHLESEVVALTSAAIQRQAECSQKKQRWRSLERLSLQHRRTASQKRGKHKLTCTSSPWQHKFRSWLLHYLVIPFQNGVSLSPCADLHSCYCRALTAHSVFVELQESALNCLLRQLLPTLSICHLGEFHNSTYCKPILWLHPECIPVVTLCDHSPCPFIQVWG